jgi:hypothetical protein
MVAEPVAITMPFFAVSVLLPPLPSTITVCASTTRPRPSTIVALFALSSVRTPPVSFLTMPSFQLCIFGTSSLTSPKLRPTSSAPCAL